MKGRELTSFRAVVPVAFLFSSLALANEGSDSLASNHAEVSTYYAEARRTCAPWDGAAFDVLIQPVAGLQQIKPPTLHVSIWHAPDLRRGGRFAFPDASGKTGAVYVQPSSGAVIALHGTVSLTIAVPDKVVEGEFDVVDPRGKPYRGRFAAPWTGHVVARCG